MGLHREAFHESELVRVPPPKRPVILKSGGEVMDLLSIEDGHGLCEWTESDGRCARIVVDIACLYECVPVK